MVCNGDCRLTNPPRPYLAQHIGSVRSPPGAQIPLQGGPYIIGILFTSLGSVQNMLGLERLEKASRASEQPPEPFSDPFWAMLVNQFLNLPPHSGGSSGPLPTDGLRQIIFWLLVIFTFTKNTSKLNRYLIFFTFYWISEHISFWLYLSNAIIICI